MSKILKMTIFDPSFLKKKHFWSNFLAAITKIGPISVIFIVIKMIVLSSKLPVLGKFVHFARSLSPQSHQFRPSLLSFKGRF